MDPNFYSWWKHARENLRDAHAEMHPCGPGGRGRHRGERGEERGGPFGRGGPFAHMHPGPFDHGDSGPFGVRRPLRFLAHKLELDEKQTEELARIIEALKTERAQAEVDHRRTIASFADAIEQDAFAEDKAREGGELRVKSAEKVREAVLAALSEWAEPL